MTRDFAAKGSGAVSTPCRQASGGAPTWNTTRYDDSLRATVYGVEAIRDPVRRAWQAGRVIELRTYMAQVRSDAVRAMRAQGMSWGEIGAKLGVTRARAWRMGQGGAEVDYGNESAADAAGV